MFTSIDKAIAAAIGAVLTFLAYHNINVEWATPEMIGTAASVLTGLWVYFWPNKE